MFAFRSIALLPSANFYHILICDKSLTNLELPLHEVLIDEHALKHGLNEDEIRYAWDNF